MPNKKYYQGIMFSKDIEKTSKLTAIKISKRLDKISNPFEPIANTNTKKILEAFLKDPNSKTYEIKSQALCSSNPFDSKMKTVSNIYKSYWDYYYWNEEREAKIIYEESNPYEYYVICEDSLKKYIFRGNMFIIQEEIKLPVCLSLEKECKFSNRTDYIYIKCEYIDYIYKYSDGSVLTVRDNEIINFYDNKKNYHNIFIGKPVDNSILINNVYNYSVLMVCFMAGGKEDMNPVFDSDKKNTMYINYTTETGRLSNCIYSNEEDDPLFNKDFLSACIYWGKRCTHPQNVAKWIEECLDRYNKIKRYYKEEV